MAALRRLRFEQSFAQVCTIVELHEQLTADGAALSDLLYDVIGASGDGVHKSALVGLRRSVFAVRRPTAREWNDQVAGVVPADLADRLRAWMSGLGAFERHSAQLPETLASESRAKQAALREIAGDAGFQRALYFASPTLFAESAKWVAVDSRRPRQQCLIRLAKYAARAAAKTSPFSTFTAIGAGTWSEAGPGVQFAESAAVEGVLELNAMLLHQLAFVLGRDPRLAAKLRLRLNPSATVIDDAVRFLGPPPDEHLVSVPAIPAVRACLRILEGGADYSIGELRDLLAGGAAPDDGRVEGFLARLVDAGLLHRQVPVPDLAADPLGDLASWLTGDGGADFAGTVSAITRVRSALRTPALVHDIEGHGAAQRLLRTAIGELIDTAGLPPAVRTEQTEDVCYESAVFTGTAAEFATPAWRPALGDLDAVRRALAAFEPALPLRVVLGAYCAERFGPGSQLPFLLLHETIAKDLASNQAPDLAAILGVSASRDSPLSESRSARLRELDRIQQGLRRHVLRPAGADGVIRVDSDVLAAASAGLPEWITALGSVAWYLQVQDAGESVRLVVNKVHAGHGRNRSRALQLIRQADETVPLDPCWAERPRTPRTAEPVVAELGGLFGFGPNRRLPSAPYEIDYPFTVSGRPAAQRIPLGDLEVVHDPRTDLAYLVAKGLKTEVNSVHLGMMADDVLPPAARLLTKAFSGANLAGPSLRMLTATDGPGIAAARIEVGRVVLRRARWVTPVEIVPRRAKGESDAGYLRRLVAWLRTHGIPTHCFVRMSPGGRRFTAAERLAGTSGAGKAHKPVYVDFANWYLVLAFERMLPGPGSTVTFEEALPVPDDAPVAGGAGPINSVMEFVVEMSEPVAGDA